MITQDRLQKVEELVRFVDKELLRQQIDTLLEAAGVAIDESVTAHQAQDATRQNDVVKQSWLSQAIVEARDE